MIGRTLASLALGGACLLSGCAKPARTIVVITLDTTRADRLGCYGYAEGRTPNLDALAEEAALFEQAHAPVPVTLPSHASMFTGEYPPVHGVRYNGMFHVQDGSVLLAERLKAAGFRTAAVPAAYPVSRESGIDQGFEVYRDLFAESKDPLPAASERKAEEVTRLGLEWLEGHPGERVFLWLHYFDPHSPYAPPFPYSAEFRDRPYDGEIAYVDQALGQLREGLARLGRWDDAVVLVAGDHGEGLYEHGEVAHADLVYQSTIHVPFLIKAPRVRGRRVPDPISLVDITPTLLELAGVEGAPMAGRSLVPLLRGKRAEARPVYFESLADSLLYGWSPLEGVRRGPWKYIRSSSPELYEISADPGERTNRHGTDVEVARDLDTELSRMEAAWSGKQAGEPAVTPMDPRQIAFLAGLGYVAGAVSTERRGGRNPRDGVHLIRAISQGRELFDLKQPRGALDAWKTVLQEDPDNRWVLLQSAYASVQVKDYQGAIGHAENLVKAYPEFAPGAIVLGELWVQRGDPARAAAVFEAAVARHPEDRALAYRHALALLSAARVAEARRILDGMLASDPETPSLWLARSAARALEGDATGAAADLEEAVRRGYDDAEVLATEPLLEPLRALPTYASAVARVREAASSKENEGRQ